MGRELLSKLKLLATLEKASAMEKYEQSHVRKLSYAATEDTASGVGKSSINFLISNFPFSYFRERNTFLDSAFHKILENFISLPKNW